MGTFRRVVKNLKVIAEANSDDKLMLVDGLMKIGRTVAVTGSSTSDAKVLQRADIGFAMGLSGTDMAK